MSTRVFDSDRSTFHLKSLRLEEGVEEVGSGSFGSIFKATIRKSSFQFQGHPRTEEWILGKYHGILLAVHSSQKSHPAVARNEEDGLIEVAVKLIKTTEKPEPEEEHELIIEASNLRVLWGHRNFVTTYGITRSRDLEQKYFDLSSRNVICLCLVMDLVHGCNLNEFLKSRGKKLADSHEEVARLCLLWESNEALWWIEKLKLFREIVMALIVCHREKVYHGDLKGANIVLDGSLIPKMVDFGLSFRRADVSYLGRGALGGSLFWCAPEATESLDSDEVDVSDPYSADVYSLGMVLAEMMLDGDIPEELTDNVWQDKYHEVWQDKPLDDLISNYDATVPLKRVLNELKELKSSCCKRERAERISLHDCLAKVNELFSYLCSQTWDLYRQADVVLTETEAFQGMVSRFQERFPDVPDCLIWRPSWNMVMDKEENLLVHYFCQLDYAEGVKYIVERSMTWGFQPERDLPYLSLLCVKEESLQSLKYLAKSWPNMMKRQLLLLHKACFCKNPELLRFLLLEVGIYFDTYEVISDKGGSLDKPIISLAALGKTELVRMILDDCAVSPDYINTASSRTTALSAALDGGDNPETVTFLLERGGTLRKKTSGHELLDAVFCLASERGHLRVCVELLEQRCNSVLVAGVDPLPGNPDSTHVVEFKSRAIDAREHLQTLQDHIRNEQAVSNPIPLKAACRKGNEEVLRSVLWLMLIPQSTKTDMNGGLANKLVYYTAFYGSPSMMDLVYMFTYGTGQFEDYKVVRPDFQMPAMKSERMRAREQEEISYARKIVLDFTTGACKELVSIHFHINYPLALAKELCQRGYLGILHFLEDQCGILAADSLPHGERWDAPQKNRWGSLLHAAALFGRVNIAKFLLEKGISANKLAREGLWGGFSPLQEAVGSGISMHRKEMVDLLLTAGADPNHRDSNGRTAMHMLNSYEDAADVVQLLMKAGFTFDRRFQMIKTNFRKPVTPRLSVPTPASEYAEGSFSYNAAAESYARKILCDFETGSCEEVVGLHFQIDHPLVLARQCCEKDYSIVLEFLEDHCGLDLNLLKEEGERPSSSQFISLLHAASIFGQVNVAEFLLNRGFGVNKAVGPQNLYSPLQVALASTRSTGKKKKAMVKFLLSRGADPNYKDIRGNTAMDMVNAPPYEDVRGLVRLLLEAGYEGGSKDRWGEDSLDLVTKLGDSSKQIWSMSEGIAWEK